MQLRTRRTAWIGTLFLACLGGQELAGAEAPPPQSNQARYHDITLGISYIPPKDWKVGYIGEVRPGIFGPKQADGWIPTLRFLRQEDPRPPETYLEEMSRVLPYTLPDARLLSQSKFPDLSGWQVERIVIECVDSETNRKMRRLIYIVAGLRLQYLVIAHISADSGDRHDATCDEVVRSLRINDQEAAARYAAEPKRFFDLNDGFSFVPPKGWSLRTPPIGDKPVLLAPAWRHGRPAGFIQLGVSALDAKEKKISLEEAGKESYEELTAKQNHRDAKLLSCEVFQTESGQKGVRTVFESQPSDMAIRVRTSINLFTNGELSFVFVTSMFLEDVPTLEPLVASALKTFRFEPTVVAPQPTAAPTSAATPTPPAADSAAAAPASPLMRAAPTDSPASAASNSSKPPNPFAAVDKPGSSFRLLDTRGGFSFEVPAGWTATPDGSPGFRSLVGPNSADASPVIYFVAEPTAGTLDDAVRAAIAKIGDGSNRAESPTDFAATDGRRGRRLIMETRTSPATRMVMYFFVDGSTKYGLAGTAPGSAGDRFDRAYDECARSFRVEKK